MFSTRRLSHLPLPIVLSVADLLNTQYIRIEKSRDTTFQTSSPSNISPTTHRATRSPPKAIRVVPCIEVAVVCVYES